jgi:hypothetical protein
MAMMSVGSSTVRPNGNSTKQAKISQTGPFWRMFSDMADMACQIPKNFSES